MDLTIISPEREIFSGAINRVKVPGSKGSFEILNNHAPIISTLEKGSIKVVDDRSNNHEFKILSGLIEVNDNKVTILADSDNAKE